MSAKYEINKGINRPIEFKGIKAQYIIYLALGLVVLLFIFAILYVLGAGLYICLGIIIPTGLGLYLTVQNYSNKYGANGLTKKSAASRLPSSIRATSRKYFIQLHKKQDEKK